MVTGEDNVKFYSNQQKIANAAKTAISIYAQKVIGLVPVIQWTPYELLFSSSSNAFSSSYNSQPKTYSQQKTQTVSSDNYGSTSSAMKAYANNTTYYDYVPYYQIDSYDGQYSKVAYGPNPLAGPGQIY
ncbi:MAG TPA: hypothetical protein IAC96_05280 [Candidatus Fimimorpha faecalis]|uniref:Uncharacterized protein n=1 Tax=Candidatus Fimimorpha faecalis TaxID=2840824 RepID=A0A9D1EE13_9FIRM|nr:hypothetical protein [Candidatus Fimimorpha faecalis]